MWKIRSYVNRRNLNPINILGIWYCPYFVPKWYKINSKYKINQPINSICFMSSGIQQPSCLLMRTGIQRRHKWIGFSCQHGMHTKKSQNHKVTFVKLTLFCVLCNYVFCRHSKRKHIGTEQRWNEWREQKKCIFLSIKLSITFNHLTVLIVGAEWYPLDT